MQRTTSCIIFSLLCIFEITLGAMMGFENGQTYKVTSVATGKFLTVDGSQFVSGASVVANEWNGQETQKWLALEAPQINSFARDVPKQRFYLIPMRQESSNWTTLAQNGTAKISLNNLPNTTEVLTLHPMTGNLTTEVRSQDTSSQQWIPEDAGDGRIFIRNLGNNQCVKNFAYRPTSLFQKIASFLSHIRQPNKPQHSSKPLGTFDCSRNEIAEKWIVELA